MMCFVMLYFVQRIHLHVVDTKLIATSTGEVATGDYREKFDNNRKNEFL